MTRIGRISIAIAILVFCVIANNLLYSIAFADEQKTLTWTVPTETVENTPLDPNTLTKYELGCDSRPSGDPAVYSQWPIAAPGVASRVETFPPGTWYCRLRIYADVGDDVDAASDWSNEVFFSIPLPRPKGPSGLSVN